VPMKMRSAPGKCLTGILNYPGLTPTINGIL
jgi:hypothetical protein